MRKLVITENMTLDGVVDQLNDWFSPSGGGDDMAEVNREHMKTTGAVLLGRTTYEEFKGYWPLQTDDKTGVTDYLNRTPKYVVSSTLTQRDADWQNTLILRGQLADEITALKNQTGADIGVSGSISLVQALAQEQLVDEYRFFIYPTFLGHGRRLFPEGMDSKLQLIGTRAFRSDVVLLVYRSA